MVLMVFMSPPPPPKSWKTWAIFLESYQTAAPHISVQYMCIENNIFKMNQNKAYSISRTCITNRFLDRNLVSQHWEKQIASSLLLSLFFQYQN